MFSAFKKHLELKQLFKPADELILAISGGADSVVLAHLLKQGGFRFSLAHCNFKLRGKDSDADEAFCRQLSKTLGVNIEVQHLDAARLSKTEGLSLQMAARQLRYTWFEQLVKEKKADYLLTAHNASDVVETLFINLLRGTGINGLKGIPEKSGTTVRPLLSFTKSQILAFAKAQKMVYREDKSNSEPKYERNFLRLKVIPLLQEWHPSLEQVVLNNIRNFKEEAELLKDILDEKAEGIIKQDKNWTRLDKTLLRAEKHGHLLLHKLLGPFGFNSSQVEDVYKNILGKGLVGKLVVSSTHTLTIDRKYLLIKENTPFKKLGTISISSLKELENLKHLKLTRIRSFKKTSGTELLLEPAKLIFPLSLRGKAKGDKFKPFGMRGFKLVSDFLKDQKLNNFEKESCKLLVNGNGEIIWVLGYRSDERYRVSEKAHDLIKLSLIE